MDEFQEAHTDPQTPATEEVHSLDPLETATPEAIAPRRNLVVTLAVVAFLLIPVVYLMVKFSGPKTPATGASTAAAPTVDLAALEQAAATAPTTANKLNLSAAYINEHQPNRALPLLKTVLAAEPSNEVAWNNFCVVHMARQDYSAAVDACSHAVSIAPKFTLAQNNLKWALGEQKRTLDDLAAIAKMAPNELTEAVYLRQGLDYLHLDRYDEAIAAWSQILRTDPRSLPAANNIGTAYMLKNQYAEAVPWFQKALSFDESSQLAKNNLAWAHDELAKAKAGQP